MHHPNLHLPPAGLATVLCVALVIASGSLATAGSWSAPIAVQQGSTTCVTYRAKLSGQWLLVEAKHEPGWHTYAMDNARRATEKLNGKTSLGMEEPTSIQALEGLRLVGPWYQTHPLDYSQPDLRWFTWGFEGTVRFASRVQRTGSGEAKICVSGQACNDMSCRLVNIEIALPGGSKEQEPGVDVSQLVAVPDELKKKSQ